MLVSVSSLYRLILFMLGVILSTGLFAQSPITVTVNVLPPYPNYADELIEMNDQTIITIQNTDISNGYSIKLRAELTGNNGITVRTKESALPSSSIELSAGETMVMTGEELSVFYNNYSENDFDFIGISREEIINNQQLPDGAYTICLRAYEYQSGIPLSATSPLGCSAPFVVLAVDPPIITYPQNNTTIATIDPQFLSINWIPVTVSLSDLRYRFEMVDLTDFPMNPYDAFETGDFLFFFEDDVIANVFLYGMEHPLLISGHKYAIRVRAYRLDGPLNVQNNGYSDIVIFNYGEEDEVITELPEGTDEGSTDPEMTDQNMACGQSCEFTLPSGQTATETKPRVGAMLDIGNFEMWVSSIHGDGPYSGEGVIQKTAFFPIGIKVEFEDIQVNADGRIFSGSAKSVIRTDSWFDETWNDMDKAIDDIQFNPNTLNQAVATLSDPTYYIDNLTGISEQVGTTLPFTMGSGSNKLQVVGMNFFPERASYNLSSIIELLDDAEGNPRYLNFMAKNLCITPGGLALSADEARLELVKPVRYNFDNKTQLEFEPAKSGVGTYLTFDCDGFNGVWAQGKVVFSPDVIKPVDDQGDIIAADTVVAGFTASFTSWSNWVATVDFAAQGENASADGKNLFMYKELEGYIIGVEEAFIDHSENANPDGMVFPENYATNTGVEWQGVYLKTIEVTLPEWIKAHDESDGRVHITGTDLIIDGEGLTGEIRAENVLSQKEGAMGKWPITVDSVYVKIQQNSLARAKFSGSLKIPVFEEPFDYNADMQFLENHTKHTFTFEPLEEYTIPMWYANTTITPNSMLTVNINDGSAYVEANLNGAISFEPVIGDIDKMNLSNITFEDFVIRSQKEPKYIEIGNFGTAGVEDLAVAGFGIGLDAMDLNEKPGDLFSLDLGLDMDLSAGDMFGIKGETGLAIQNKIKDLVDSLTFEFDGVDINDIALEANAGVVDMKGSVSFFKDDEKFGEGFEGNIEVSFIESIRLRGSVLFGNVASTETGNNINYWYANAMAYMPNAPVPMATPLDIYGFGGGVYKNLTLGEAKFPNPRLKKESDEEEDSEEQEEEYKSPRELYNVEEGILGFEATVVMGLTPSSRTFNADVTLAAEINLNTGGLNELKLAGSGYIMQDIEDEDKSHSMVQAKVDINYNFPTKIFSANFGVLGKIPYSTPLLTVTGDIDFFRSPDTWYLKAGVPRDMMGATLNLGIGGITAEGYFQTGQELEPPILPPEVNLTIESHMINNTSNGLGMGFMAGLHLGMDIELTVAGTGVTVKAGAGADISLLNYYAATCNGNADFGINKWYAQGQGYIYGSVALSLFWFDVASVELDIFVEAAFPNPTGVQGLIKVEGTFMGGAHKWEKQFSLGSFCDIQPMANAGSMVDPLEAELDNLPLLGAITPANGLSNVKTTVKPTIEWYQVDRSTKRFTYGDGQGGMIDKMYRIRNTYTWEVQSTSNGTWNDVTHTADTDYETNITTLQAAMNQTGTNGTGQPTTTTVPALLTGGAKYRIKAVSAIEQYSDEYLNNVNGYENDSNWEQANYTEGDHQGEPIKESKTYVFETGGNLTEIEPLNVDYTLPYPRQRFYPYEYLSTGKIKFNISHEAKFQDFNTCGFEIYAEFTPVDGSAAPPRQKVDRPQPLIAEFNMTALEPEKIYKLEIIAERKVTEMQLMQYDNPTCKLPGSDGGSNALSEYIAGNGIEIDLGNFNGMASPSSGGQMSMGSGSSGGSGSSNSGMALAGPSLVNSGIVAPQTLNLGPANNDVGDMFSMMNDTVTHRKKLFTIYFRTSKFSTPEAKMESVKVSEFTMEPHYLSLQNIPQTIVQDVSIKIDCEEGFDKYDLFGHDYQTQETMEYFRFSGPSCRSISHSGLAQNVTDWFQVVCPSIVGLQESTGFDQMITQAQDVMPGLDLEFESDPSNYTGVKQIEPLLSDAEVGLVSSDGSTGYSGLSVYGSGTMSGPGLVLVGNPISPGWIIGGSSGSLAPSTHVIDNSGGAPELEIKYELDRHAAGLYNYYMNYILEEGTGIENPTDFPYVHPPEGNYPITIRLMNIPQSQSESPNYKSKEFNVTIPF